MLGADSPPSRSMGSIKHLGTDGSCRPARQGGSGDAGVYKWPAKYGGMDVAEAERLKAPKRERPTQEALAKARSDIRR